MHRLFRFFIVLVLAGIAPCLMGRPVSTTVIFVPSATPAPSSPAPAPGVKVAEESPALKKAKAAKPWQRIDLCRWKVDRWNDGDSFHVMTGDADREIVARLYFVDTPEAETAYRDRLDEQAAYFGITREQAIEIAHEAAIFTEQRLALPFTVWTRWRSALGRSALGRIYCIIIDSTGADLNEELGRNGFARIYGTRTTLWDGRDSKVYLAHLAELEVQARREHKGGWRFAP